MSNVCTQCHSTMALAVNHAIENVFYVTLDPSRERYQTSDGAYLCFLKSLAEVRLAVLVHTVAEGFD